MVPVYFVIKTSHLPFKYYAFGNKKEALLRLYSTFKYLLFLINLKNYLYKHFRQIVHAMIEIQMRKYK